ncbi:uncharacterized protein J3R85_016785 [Psidium guajava]|nr:uncharacterized protein J3R85_016785 [Psidium guajava]
MVFILNLCSGLRLEIKQRIPCLIGLEVRNEGSYSDSIKMEESKSVSYRLREFEKLLKVSELQNQNILTASESDCEAHIEA